MSMFLSVRALHEEGVPKKTIARRLGVDRRTVRKYIKRIEAGEREPLRRSTPSKLEPVRELIESKVQQGLSAVQIYQDLCSLPDFDAGYDLVKLLVRKLRPKEPEVYCRMQFAPGEEAQIDFGEVGRMRVTGGERRVWLFAMTLCFSRYSYYELVLDQTVPTFLGAIRRGFEDFGGAPERIKPDNLRSAVLLTSLGERYYQEDFFKLCQHYGCVPDAARPRTPTDKGRTERDIGYVKHSCFEGRGITDFDLAIRHLARWRQEVALVRIHGTTRRRPVDLFEEERNRLRALPASPYEVASLGLYRVRKDCHVHVAGNYYSVPYLLVGKKVTVRLAERDVSVVFDGERVAQHARALGRGQSVTDTSHYPPTKRLATQEIHRRRVEAVRSVGPRTVEYLGRLRHGRWVFGDQVARLHRLLGSFGPVALESACQRALHYGALDGAVRIESILDRGLEGLPLPDLSGDSRDSGRDFGRPLAEYDELLAAGEVA